MPASLIAAPVFPADRAIMPSKAGWDGTRLQRTADSPLTPIRAHKIGTAINIVKTVEKRYGNE